METSRLQKALNTPPFDLDQIAKVIDIRFASVELVEVAAKMLKGLMQACADEAASTMATSDNVGEESMQNVTETESTDVKSKTNTSGAACTSTSQGTKELSSHEGDEEEPPQTTSEKEGASAPNDTSGEHACCSRRRCGHKQKQPTHISSESTGRDI